MPILTRATVYPVILDLGDDPIWFGVIRVVGLEMGLISPPVGILPFWAAVLICLTFPVLFPPIALFLPDAMSGRG